MHLVQMRGILLLIIITLSNSVLADALDFACEPNSLSTYEISNRGADLLPTIRLIVNGEPKNLILDTGATQTILYSSTNTLSEDRIRSVASVGGKVKGNLVSSTVEIASIKIPVDALVIVPNDHPYNIDGIVGMDVLGKLQFQINIRTHKFLASANLSSCTNPGTLTPLTYRAGNDNRPRVQVLVNGVPFIALIDSGAGYSTITSSEITKLVKPSTSNETITIAGLDGTPIKGRPVSVTLGFDDNLPRTILMIAIDASVNDKKRDYQVVIGNDWLRAHDVQINLRAMRIWYGNPEAESILANDWIERESNAGNADADYYMFQNLIRKHEPTIAQKHLLRAASSGQPSANYILGRRHFLEGDKLSALTYLQRAINIDGRNLYSSMWLYLASAHLNSEAALRDLLSRYDPSETKWPAPILSYFLGRISQEKLISVAPSGRKCEAIYYAEQISNVPAAGPLNRAPSSSDLAECRSATKKD